MSGVELISTGGLIVGEVMARAISRLQQTLKVVETEQGFEVQAIGSGFVPLPVFYGNQWLSVMAHQEHGDIGLWVVAWIAKVAEKDLVLPDTTTLPPNASSVSALWSDPWSEHGRALAEALGFLLPKPKFNQPIKF